MWQDTFRIGVERPSRVRDRATYIRRTVATGMEKRRDICVRDETRSASHPAVTLAFYESTARAAAARFFLYFPFPRCSCVGVCTVLFILCYVFFSRLLQISVFTYACVSCSPAYTHTHCIIDAYSRAQMNRWWCHSVFYRGRPCPFRRGVDTPMCEHHSSSARYIPPRRTRPLKRGTSVFIPLC